MGAPENILPSGLISHNNRVILKIIIFSLTWKLRFYVKHAKEDRF